MKAPLSQARILSMRSKYVVGTLDQQATEIDVAGLADAELRISVARLAASWPQAKVAAPPRRLFGLRQPVACDFVLRLRIDLPFDTCQKFNERKR